MNTPVVTDADAAEIESRLKLIRGVGTTELVLGVLCAVAAAIYGVFAQKHAFPAGVPIWTSLTAPPALNMLHVVWTMYLMSFFLFWHGGLCRRLQRPLRPVGFAVGALLSFKLAYGAISLGFLRAVMDSINLTANGNAVNFGDRFGIYVDFAICGVAVLALLAACFVALCVSQSTKRALESSDQARYTLDSIPLSVFLGVVLFICLSYSYLADLVPPSPILADAHLSTLMQQAVSLALAAGSALVAWAFYTRRPWGWFAALLVGVAWAVCSYYPPDDVSRFLSAPEFDKYRDSVDQMIPAFQQYMLFDDILLFVALGVLIGYLIYVRRHLVDGHRAPSPGLSGSGVSIYADWQRVVKVFGRFWLIFGVIAALQWFQGDYFIGVIFIGIAVLYIPIMAIGIFMPRYVFRDGGLALPGMSLLATPVFPYASFRSVQFITTPKPPRPMRSIEDGVLNLNVSVFEEEFRKRGITVTR
jgi:hypothetical protein